MAQTVLITLTTAGMDTGPFNLYTNIDGYTIPFEVNVSKLSLEGGFVSFLVPDTASIIRVQSVNSLCTNYVNIPLTLTTTTTTSTSTTSTTSSTTTIAPLEDFTVSGETSEAIGGVPTYDVDYDTYHVENMVGNDSFGPVSQTPPSGSFNVLCRMVKTSNSGLAEDVTQVNWYKNAALQHTENYLAGNLIDYSYTFVGVVPGDDLNVTLVEG
jgi:hypothetical protein